RALVESRLRREGGRVVIESKLVDPASGRVIATASGPPEQVGSALATALRPAISQAPHDGHPVDDGGGSSSPYSTRWWFWTIVGVAVAGGAVAAFTLSSGDHVGVVFHR